MPSLETILSALSQVKRSAAGYSAQCPAHADRKPSLSISEEGGKILLHCFAGCSQGAVIRALKKLGAWNGSGQTHQAGELPAEFKGEPITAWYAYEDAGGRTVFRVGRTPSKQFPMFAEGKWGRNGAQMVLYRLPYILSSDHIFLCEGEKDADRVSSMGLCGTTAPGGAAGRWLNGYSESLEGRHVVILPDADKPGRERAERVARELHSRAASVKILDLWADREDGSDVSAWAKGFEEPEAAGERLCTLADRVDDFEAQGQADKKAAPTPVVCMADVEPSLVDFLLDPYLPIGKITLFDGDPGAGKTYSSCAIAAAVSLGKGAPGMQPRQPANTLFLSAEDGLSDTLRPRFDFLDADHRRVFCVKELLEFDADGLGKLAGYLSQVKPVLCVIDPLSAYLGANVDAFRDNHVRPILSELASLAERFSCAFLVLRHLTKATKGKAIYRGQGSIGFIAAARSGLLAGEDPNQPGHYALLHVKHNLSRKGDPIGYQIDQGRFFWTGNSHLSESDILNEITEEEKTAMEEAVEFLADALSHGPVLKEKLEERAKREKISQRTLYRARKRLQVKTKRNGFQGPAYWHLPDDEEANFATNFATAGKDGRETRK